MTKLTLLSDEPSGHLRENRDGLGFGHYSDALAQVIKDTPGPFNIGVYGEWGMGKTTLMQMVREHLEPDTVTVWFNPWLYQEESQPLISLMQTIVTELRARKKHLESSIRFKKLLKFCALLLVGTQAVMELDISGKLLSGFLAKVDFTPDKIWEKLQGEDASKSSELEGLYQPSLIDSVRKELRSGAGNSEKIVVFLDDLDRCMPEKALRLIEHLKLILDLPDFVFVIALARGSLETYVRTRYTRDYGMEYPQVGRYLEKIIQFSFRIPIHLEKEEKLWQKSFASQLEQQEDIGFLEKLFPFVFQACHHNPRAAKSLLNHILFDRYLQRKIGPAKPGWEFFIVTRLLWMRWDRFFPLLAYDEKVRKSWFRYLQCNTQEEQDIYLGRNILPCIKEMSEHVDFCNFCKEEAVQSWLDKSRLRNATLTYYEDRFASFRRKQSTKVLWLLSSSLGQQKPLWLEQLGIAFEGEALQPVVKNLGDDIDGYTHEFKHIFTVLDSFQLNFQEQHLNELAPLFPLNREEPGLITLVLSAVREGERGPAGLGEFETVHLPENQSFESSSILQCIKLLIGHLLPNRP